MCIYIYTYIYKVCIYIYIYKYIYDIMIYMFINLRKFAYIWKVLLSGFGHKYCQTIKLLWTLISDISRSNRLIVFILAPGKHHNKEANTTFLAEFSKTFLNSFKVRVALRQRIGFREVKINSVNNTHRFHFSLKYV